MGGAARAESTPTSAPTPSTRPPSTPTKGSLGSAMTPSSASPRPATADSTSEKVRAVLHEPVYTRADRGSSPTPAEALSGLHAAIAALGGLVGRRAALVDVALPKIAGMATTSRSRPRVARPKAPRYETRYSSCFVVELTAATRHQFTQQPVVIRRPAECHATPELTMSSDLIIEFASRRASRRGGTLRSRRHARSA